MCDPQRGELHARACTLNALGAMVGVAQHTLQTQGHRIVLEIKTVTGSLGEYVTATEIAIREEEAMHDLIMLDHDIALHSFTVSRLNALEDRVLRVIEVMNDGNGGRTTGVFEIDHRTTPADRRKPGGFEHRDALSVLVFHSTAQSKNTSCYCHTPELPEKVQLLVDYNEWANSLRRQGMAVESFVAGWRDAPGIAKRLDKPIATDTLPPRALCNGKGGQRYRFPTQKIPSSSRVDRALQDPTGRAGSLAVLEGLLGDSIATRPLSSQLSDGSTEIRDGGYDEIDHPGSENGWARLVDTVSTRHIGLGSPSPARQCTESICFCPGMTNCLAEPLTRKDSPPLSRAELAGELHEEQPKGKVGLFFRGGAGAEYQKRAVGDTRGPSPD